MSVKERERRQLQEALVNTLGTQSTDTLMGYLPPVGWADVATKTDLEQYATKADLHRELRTQLIHVITIMIALLTLQGAIVTSIIKLT